MQGRGELHCDGRLRHAEVPAPSTSMDRQLVNTKATLCVVTLECKCLAVVVVVRTVCTTRVSVHTR